MKKSNTSQRLKEIMEKENLRQIDILEKCKPYCDKYNEKINKSHLSQWVSGINEPNQNKLTILAMALNVSETWLMGYDIDLNLDLSNPEQDAELLLMDETSKKYALKLYQLPDTKKKVVMDMIDQLYQGGKI